MGYCNRFLRILIKHKRMTDKEQSINKRLKELQEESVKHTEASLAYMKQMGIQPEGKLSLFLPPDYREKTIHNLPFEHKVRQQVIYETEQGEFSALCPFSGLPDYGILRIAYIPGSWILELKSLKYYIMSWRHIGIAQEDVTAYIYQDVQEHLRDAQQLTVTTDYNIRGGIHTTCVIDSEQQ